MAKVLRRSSHPCGRTGMTKSEKHLNMRPRLAIRVASLDYGEQVGEIQYAWETVKRQKRNHRLSRERWWGGQPAGYI
jgi:hypothetical protein